MITTEDALQAYKDTDITPIPADTLLVGEESGKCGCVVGVYYVWKNGLEVDEENQFEFGINAHKFVNELYGTSALNYDELGDSGCLGLGFDDAFNNKPNPVNDREFPDYHYSYSKMYQDGYKIGEVIREWYNGE